MVNIVRKVALVAALGFAGSVFAAANNTTDGVAVVDLTQVFQQVPQGQPAFDQLQKSVASQANNLQSQQDALNKKIQAFQAQTSLTPAQRNAQQADLITQQAQLQKSINDYQNSLRQSQQKLLTTFGDNMKGVVTQISQNNGYHLVLSSQTAVYSDNSVDITPQVIAAMKKK